MTITKSVIKGGAMALDWPGDPPRGQNPDDPADAITAALILVCWSLGGERCEVCDGHGTDDVISSQMCSTCTGKGWIHESVDTGRPDHLIQAGFLLMAQDPSLPLFEIVMAARLRNLPLSKGANPIRNDQWAVDALATHADRLQSEGVRVGLWIAAWLDGSPKALMEAEEDLIDWLIDLIMHNQDRQRECSRCRGSGKTTRAGGGLTDCGKCKGRGWS